MTPGRLGIGACYGRFFRKLFDVGRLRYLDRAKKKWLFGVFLADVLLLAVDFGAAFAGGHVAGSFDPACGVVEIGQLR